MGFFFLHEISDTQPKSSRLSEFGKFKKKKKVLRVIIQNVKLLNTSFALCTHHNKRLIEKAKIDKYE